MADLKDEGFVGMGCTVVTPRNDADGDGFYDPDGDPLTFEWHTDCQNIQLTDPFAEITTLTVTHPTHCAMVCAVWLKVTDPMGLDDSEAASLTLIDPFL